MTPRRLLRALNFSRKTSEVIYMALPSLRASAMYKTIPAKPGGLRCLSYEKFILANASARGVGPTR
jgi:hypothetical protein